MELDTSYKVTTLSISSMPPIIGLFTSVYYSCYNVTGADTIQSITNNFKISPLNAGDTVNSNFVYMADTIKLIDENLIWGGGSIHISPDTTNFITNFSYVECDQFPMDTVKFIGFKTKINNVDKFG